MTRICHKHVWLRLLNTFVVDNPSPQQFDGTHGKEGRKRKSVQVWSHCQCFLNLKTRKEITNGIVF
ncbi:hypothetical protein DPMN_172969 [Dreissena polymorpha]|uniref:Uncharacterized protein n=1 Tax=Dreissena polymorpha TaxID=45954 RepID=A0A9D4E2J3_DREPO|nr:hypothetical protein DPMN_172969 [Dreissena polymorpha]